MARIGSSMGNARNQRINQAKFGDITVRYGKDKRSNVNRKLPSSFKTNNYEPNKLSKRSFTGSGTIHRTRVSRENYNRNRITLSKFIKMSLFCTVIFLSIWIYSAGEETVVRQKRSISEVLTQLSNKYVASGYTGGQSAAAWTRQRRSKGAHSDDMSNPHNGATGEDSIIQKVLADFAKLVKSESEGYSSNNSDDNKNNDDIKNDDNTINNNSNNNDL